MPVALFDVTVYIFFQLTFQAVLATDGEASFAIFMYEDLQIVRNISSQERGRVGFDAGDQTRSSTVLYGVEELPLSHVNIFRIDGKHHVRIIGQLVITNLF